MSQQSVGDDEKVTRHPGPHASDFASQYRRAASTLIAPGPLNGDPSVQPAMAPLVAPSTIPTPSRMLLGVSPDQFFERHASEYHRVVVVLTQQVASHVLGIDERGVPIPN
jgi:hypothetical protein